MTRNRTFLGAAALLAAVTGLAGHAAQAGEGFKPLFIVVLGGCSLG